MVLCSTGVTKIVSTNLEGMHIQQANQPVSSVAARLVFVKWLPSWRRPPLTDQSECPAPAPVYVRPPRSPLPCADGKLRWPTLSLPPSSPALSVALIPRKRIRIKILHTEKFLPPFQSIIIENFATHFIHLSHFCLQMKFLISKAITK